MAIDEAPAQTVQTVRIPVPGGSMRAFVAYPSTGSPAAGVILFHEVFGLNDDMAEKAQRFAAMGYVALAPDLYAGQGRKPFCLVRTFRALGKAEGGVFANIEAARAWLAGQPSVDASRLGVCGFCMGGGFALLDAARAHYGAAAVFYGMLPKQDAAFDGICPVVAGFGGRDGTLKGAAAKLEAALEARGVEHDVKEYPGAGHGYLSSHDGLFARVMRAGPAKVGFHPASAEDSWARVEAFFARHLGGQ